MVEGGLPRLSRSPDVMVVVSGRWGASFRKGLSLEGLLTGECPLGCSVKWEMRRDEGEEFWQKLECGKRNCGIHDGPPMLFGNYFLARFYSVLFST